MKPLSEIYNELGIAFSFPIEIKDANGNETYYEDSNGYWYRSEYDANDNQTYYENSNGFWYKCEYNANGDETYYEDSDGYKLGTPRSAKTCEGKVVEVDGVKYELKALHITADCHEEGGEFFVTDQSGNGNHAKFNHSQQS